MKEEDFIERKEKILLAALGKSWLWKASRLIIGIIPPVGAFVMLVHCSLLSMGYRVKLTEWIFDCSLFGFGVLRQPLHLLMVALGLLLFFVFIKKKAWNEFYDRNINHLNK